MSDCKGFEIEPGHWSGCNTAETGAKDCPACSPLPVRRFIFEWELKAGMADLPPYAKNILLENEQKLSNIQTFERMLATPLKLLNMIASGELRPGLLTFAAEIAGRITDSESVIPVLLKLLDHTSPMVREGAICGLANHMSQEVIARIVAICQTDPVPEVRSIAKIILAREV